MVSVQGEEPKIITFEKPNITSITHQQYQRKIFMVNCGPDTLSLGANGSVVDSK
jgi:hypothetical protein